MAELRNNNVVTIDLNSKEQNPGPKLMLLNRDDIQGARL